MRSENVQVTYDYSDYRVVVTGAGDGIGRGTAEAFHAAGASVLAVDLNGAGLEELAAAGMKTLLQDVTEEAAPANIILKAEALLGGLDVLVNNAGICPVASLAETEDAVWDQTMNVNLRSMFRLSREALPLLTASGAGRIVNIASVSALLANAGMGAYTASKHGVAGFSKSLAVEVGKDGITVNYILPGAIVTGITRELIEVDEDFRNFWIEKAAVGRWGLPEDIAKAILFLASREADFITGHGLSVDGGAVVRA
jgi:NAD(P)-dependent dehydrogenase (short-subunit alcohol dehydrogenase family)